tara:strand:- start:6304 stop:7203 length:900 start_codon:yes stop_codon:yes gene_type:complete
LAFPTSRYADLGLLPGQSIDVRGAEEDRQACLVFAPEDALLVVCLPLQGLDDRAFARALRLITPEERARAGRFHFEKDQKLYVAAHGLLRYLLGLAGDCDPLGLRFTAGAHGKPALVCPPRQLAAAAMPVFNISHCDGMVSCALARPGLEAAGAAVAVGVDVECLARRPVDLGLARRYFRAEEEAQILAFPEPQRQQAFLAFWTLKEAIIKADGRGLTLALDSFAFELDAAFRPTSLFFAPRLNQAVAQWQVLRFHPSARHLGAVALRRQAGVGTQESSATQDPPPGRRRHLQLQDFPG